MCKNIIKETNESKLVVYQKVYKGLSFPDVIINIILNYIEFKFDKLQKENIIQYFSTITTNKLLGNIKHDIYYTYDSCTLYAGNLITQSSILIHDTILNINEMSRIEYIGYYKNIIYIYDKKEYMYILNTKYTLIKRVRMHFIFSPSKIHFRNDRCYIVSYRCVDVYTLDFNLITCIGINPFNNCLCINKNIHVLRPLQNSTIKKYTSDFKEHTTILNTDLSRCDIQNFMIIDNEYYIIVFGIMYKYYNYKFVYFDNLTKNIVNCITMKNEMYVIHNNLTISHYKKVYITVD